MKFTCVILLPACTGRVTSPMTVKPLGPMPCRTSAVDGWIWGRDSTGIELRWWRGNTFLRAPESSRAHISSPCISILTLISPSRPLVQVTTVPGWGAGVRLTLGVCCLGRRGEGQFLCRCPTPEQLWQMNSAEVISTFLLFFGSHRWRGFLSGGPVDPAAPPTGSSHVTTLVSRTVAALALRSAEFR